jgi:hypothetical protein
MTERNNPTYAPSRSPAENARLIQHQPEPAGTASTMTQKTDPVLSAGQHQRRSRFS